MCVCVHIYLFLHFKKPLTLKLDPKNMINHKGQKGINITVRTFFVVRVLTISHDVLHIQKMQKKKSKLNIESITKPIYLTVYSTGNITSQRKMILNSFLYIFSEIYYKDKKLQRKFEFLCLK